MQKWEEKIIEREKGKAEGLAEGKAISVIELLTELGEVPEALRAQVLAQTDPTILSAWLKKAARADSIAAFADTTGLKS